MTIENIINAIRDNKDAIDSSMENLRCAFYDVFNDENAPDYPFAYDTDEYVFNFEENTIGGVPVAVLDATNDRMIEMWKFAKNDMEIGTVRQILHRNRDLIEQFNIRDGDSSDERKAFLESHKRVESTLEDMIADRARLLKDNEGVDMLSNAI